MSSADLAQMALEQSKRPLASRARDGTCPDRANGERGDLDSIVARTGRTKTKTNTKVAGNGFLIISTN